MSESASPMTVTDYLGFASMTLLLVGAANWGVVAIRYAIGALPAMDSEGMKALIAMPNATKYDVYKAVPAPDLLELLNASAEVQMFVYWAVFASGIFYLLLFIWNSIETRTVE